MHILFLTDNFPPEVNAPASRTHEHAREWVSAGHQVTVITCAPNFPAGKVFAGYRNRPWQRETMDGIDVVRVWSYIAANEGFGRRIADYLSFMVAATIATLFIRKPDVIVATSPQFFTACAGYVGSRLKRVPFVFEVRDLWPESIRAVGAMKDGLAFRLLQKLEYVLYRKAALIIAVTQAFKDTITAGGIDPAKIEVVTNGVDLARFQPQKRDADLAVDLGLAGGFVAGYVGTHGMAHALETVLDAAAILKAREDGHRFFVLMLGDGAAKPALVRQAQERKLDNVIFVDTVAKADVPRYWSLLDAAIIHLKATPLFETVIPSKLFEVMGMGIPVLLGVRGEAARIAGERGVGVMFEPQNAQSLADAIVALADDRAGRREMAGRALEAAPEFDRSKLAATMLTHLERVAS